MRYLAYAKGVLLDMMLYIVAAWSLTATLSDGFYISETMPLFVAKSLSVIVACALMFYGFGYSRTTIVAGVPACAVACVVACVAFAQMTPVNLFDDSYENTSLILVLSLFVAIGTFLLTRHKAAIVIFGVAGSVSCSIMQFLYGNEHVLYTVLFMASCIALIACRSSREVGRGQERAIGKSVMCVCSALLVCLASLGLACAVFFLVIEPLNPPVHELKLITERYSLEEVHVSGLTSLFHKPNEDISSNDTKDGSNTSSALDEDELETVEGESASDSGGEDQSLSAGAFGSWGNDISAKALRYFAENWGLILTTLVAAVVAICILVVLIRRLLRKRNIERMWSLEPRESAVQMYRYIRSGLERMRVCNRGCMTPAELAENAREKTRRFERGDMPLDFDEITDIVMQAAYGGVPPTDDERNRLKVYCTQFPAHALRYVGRLRYLSVFFRV